MTKAGIRKRDRSDAIAAANRRRANTVTMKCYLGTVEWKNAVEAGADLGCSASLVRRVMNGWDATKLQKLNMEWRLINLLKDVDRMKHGRVVK